jgi:large subunit ribosomal protein L13
METYSTRLKDITRDWFIIDATDKPLGRLASNIAHRIRGKHKPTYTPSMDTGDNIVVINTDKMFISGNKKQNKIYHKHTGFVGHLKSTKLADMLAKDSTRVLQLAVKGMMPKNPLGRAMLKKLKLYANDNHKHQAQNPIELKINKE